MKKKQWMAVAATVVLGNSFLAGYTTPETKSHAAPVRRDSQVTVRFYEAMSGNLGKQLAALTKTFQAQNPNINVQLIFANSYTTLQQKLTASIAAKQPPTISQVQETWETEYYNSGLLDPLQNYIPKATQDDLIKIFKDDNSYDGKLVSMPFNKSAYVLFYNTEALAKAGIKAPPKNWTELEQDAIKVTKANPGMYGLGMNANWYTFEMLLNQQGGKDLTSDNKKAAFNTPAGQKALNFMKKLVLDDKAATVVSGYLSDGFNTAKYAMSLDTVASMSFYTNPKLRWKAAPLPMGTKAATPVTGANIVLFKSASAEEKAAAAKYIDFLVSRQNTIKWAETTGYLPVRQSALKDPSWVGFVFKHTSNGVAPKELVNGYFSPRLAQMFSGQNQATTHVGNALSGKETVDTALNNMEQAINQALQGD